MKHAYRCILFFSVLIGVTFGQSGELAEMMSDLQIAVGPVQAGSKRYESKVGFIEPAGIRYEFDEVDSKGKSVNYVYEFNVADIDPYAVRSQTQKDLISVVLAVKGKQSLVKVYKNNEVQSYQEQALIYAKDIDNARRIVEIVKNGIPAAEKIMAARLNISGYDDAIDWLTNNVNDVTLGATSRMQQKIARADSPGSLLYTRVTMDSKSSTEEIFNFNAADINPLSIKYNISGNKFGVHFETLQKAKYIASRKNADARPFVSELTINTDNVDAARDLKTVLAMLAPLAIERVKSAMPAINSGSEAFAQIKELTTDIDLGQKRISQTIESMCTVKLAQLEQDSKGSDTNEFMFSWMDMSPNNSLVEASGERMFLNIKTLEGKRLIRAVKNGKSAGYNNSVRLLMPNIENARRAKFAADKAIENCKTDYREPFGDNTQSAISWFADNIKDLSVDEVTLVQKFESVEDGNVNKWKYTRREVNPKGNGSEEIFEINLSDINHLSITTETSGNWLYVVMGTEFRGKVIKAYKNGKIMPYTNRIEFAINDAEVARNAVNALKKAVTTQKR